MTTIPILRHGQWVKFPAEPSRYEGAHRGADGQVVGIFQQEARSLAGSLLKPAHVAVVRTDGADAGYYPNLSDRLALSHADWYKDVPKSRLFPAVV